MKRSLASNAGTIMKRAQYLAVFCMALSISADGIACYSTAAEKLSLDRAVVITDDGQPPFVKYCVEELANYLKELTGHNLPIRNPSDATGRSENKVSILVGQQAAREIFPSQSRT